MTHYHEGGLQIHRIESPAIEHAFQDELIRIFQELFESKGLYQNLHVNTALFDRLSPNFVSEFSKRPIVAYTHHYDGPRSRQEGGAQPTGTPADELEIGFFLPNVNLDYQICERSSSYVVTSYWQRIPSGGPLTIVASETEQLFAPSYRCAVCRKNYIVFQVRRSGLKFQLTGRSSPFRPPISNEWPKDIRKIVQDAVAASAENDTPAAYYHLRTAMEFYLKAELSIPTTDKTDGATLCDRYNEKSDQRLKSGFPSLAPMYAELSTGLHSRVTDGARFIRIMSEFLDHLKAKALFEQYANTPNATATPP